MLAGCDGGSGSSGQGAPPGQGAPGGPVAGGGGGAGTEGQSSPGGGGGAVVAPYKIPDTVRRQGEPIADQTAWTDWLGRFWAACPGNTHCVRPVLVVHDLPDFGGDPCAFYDLEVDGQRIETDTVPQGTEIQVVVRAPCPAFGVGTTDGPSPESPSPQESITP
jgi:hypothetical protein